MSGPLIVPTTTATPSTWPTASQYIEAVADELGERLYSTISSQAVSGEPGRWALVDDLKDDERARAMYRGGWVHIHNGPLIGQDRRIRDEGYEGPSGALAVSRVFAVGSTPTTPPANTLVTVLTPLPWTRVGTTTGVMQFVNLALRQTQTEIRVARTGNGTGMYSLADVPWLASQQQTDGIYDSLPTLSSTIVPPSLSGYEPTIRVNGATITLETGYAYSSADTFYLKAFVRGDRFTYDSGSGAWGYTTNGLVNDADQAAVPLEFALPIAVAKALQYLDRLVRAQRRSGEISADEAADRLTEIHDPLHGLPHWTDAANRTLKNSVPRSMSSRRTTTLLPSLQTQGF